MPQQTGSARSYELLLIAVIAARATSFIFSKMILESLAPFNLLAVRFIIAFVLLALGQGELSGGFTWGLLAGLCYAAAIIITERLSHGSNSTLGIGIVQVGTMGVLSFLAMLLTETPQLPQSGSQWLMLAMLIIVCTGFGFTLQPMAQSHVSAARAGLFCAVSPAIAALLGITVLGEPFGTLDVLGLVLILASIVMPYVRR